MWGEHTAFGDTGVVIYANSVMGACSNFESGDELHIEPDAGLVTILNRDA